LDDNVVEGRGKGLCCGDCVGVCRRDVCLAESSCFDTVVRREEGSETVVLVACYYTDQLHVQNLGFMEGTFEAVAPIIEPCVLLDWRCVCQSEAEKLQQEDYGPHFRSLISLCLVLKMLSGGNKWWNEGCYIRGRELWADPQLEAGVTLVMRVSGVT